MNRAQSMLPSHDIRSLTYTPRISSSQNQFVTNGVELFNLINDFKLELVSVKDMYRWSQTKTKNISEHFISTSCSSWEKKKKLNLNTGPN